MTLKNRVWSTFYVIYAIYARAFVHTFSKKPKHAKALQYANQPPNAPSTSGAEKIGAHQLILFSTT
jgi:hypothetical protein